MGVDIAAQGFNFLEGLAAGVGLGLLYDLLRVLRERLRRRPVVLLLDLCFWLTATAVLFLFAILRGDGMVRLYQGLSFVMGGGGYFLTLSRLTLPLLRLLADGWAFLWNLILRPFRGTARLGKKLLKKQKKDFHIWLEWYRINVIQHPADHRRKGADRNADKKGRHRHKIRHTGSSRGVGDGAAVDEQPSGGGQSGA